MEKLKRQYLNSKEENFYMMAKVMSMLLNGDTDCTEGGDSMLQTFEKTGMLTKDTKRSLKMCMTYLDKFLGETYFLLDDREQKKITKKTLGFNLKFINDYEAEKLNRDIADKKKYVSIKRELFEEVADILGQECVNCTKDYRKCNLYDVFEDTLTVGNGECKNCKYACRL